MPIYDIVCEDCGHAAEVIHLLPSQPLACPACGGTRVARRISPTSGLTGKTPRSHPGPGDTGCCGSSPGAAGCAGPGSCCGRGPGS